MMQQSSFFQNRKAMINRIKQWFQFPPGIIPQDDVEITEDQEQLSENDLSSIEAKTTSSSPETKIVPQVKDADLEYLFYQLLEGIVNGWQEKRVAQFLRKLEPKISQENWLEWLERYRRQLLASPSPHNQLRERMMLLGKLKSTTSISFVRVIASAADEISQELLNRRIHLFTGDYFSLSNTTEANSSVSDYQTPTDDQSSASKSYPNIFGSIISLLQKNPLLKLTRDKTVDPESSVDPAMIMANIDEETSSDTQPVLITETNNSKIQSAQSALINEDVNSQSEPVSIIETTNSQINSALINEDVNFDSESASITETTNSQINSALIHEDVNSEGELALINEDVNFDSESALITEEIDSETQAVFSNINYSLSAEDIFGVALEKAQAGELEKALSLWQEVVTLDPDFAPAWHNLGSAFAYLNQLTEAIECFDKALGININDYLSWNDRGNALFRSKKWQEAIISWDRVIGIKPDFEQAWYHRGLALEKLEEYADAMISYKKSLSINPEFSQAKKRYQKLRLSTVIVSAGKRQKVMAKK